MKDFQWISFETIVLKVLKSLDNLIEKKLVKRNRKNELKNLFFYQSKGFLMFETI